jgi:hypothetical protein
VGAGAAVNLGELNDWVGEEEPASAEEALRFEWKHECRGCGKAINSRWRFCQHCNRQKAWVKAAKKRWLELVGEPDARYPERRYGV